MNVSIAEREQVLRDSPVFASLQSDHLRLLAEMVRVERFSAGDLVCRAGEPASELYVIVSGELSVTLPGASSPIRTMRPHEVLGEYGMFGRGVRTSTVSAITDTVLLSLAYPQFRELLLGYPTVCLTLLELTVARLTENQERQL
jgi:CRP-like cAMP-binding protein